MPQQPTVLAVELASFVGTNLCSEQSDLCKETKANNKEHRFEDGFAV